MTVRSHRADDVVDEVGVWLAGEFAGRLPASEIDRVVRIYDPRDRPVYVSGRHVATQYLWPLRR